MSTLKITHKLFENVVLKSGDKTFPSISLNRASSILPLLLASITSAVSDIEECNSLLTFDLIVDKSAMWSLKATKIKIKDEAEIIRIIEHLNISGNILRFFEKKVTGKSEFSSYDFEDYRLYVRDKLSVYDDGCILSVSALSFIFETNALESYHEWLNDPFRIADSYLNESTISDFPNVNHLLAPSKFDLSKEYPLLESDEQKLFDELTYVLTADYVSRAHTNEIYDLNSGFMRLSHLQANEYALLAAIMGHSRTLESIAQSCQCQPYQIIFPEKVYKYREKLHEAVYTRLSDKAATWFSEVKPFTCDIGITNSLERLLAHSLTEDGFRVDKLVQNIMLSTHSVLSEFVSVNKQNNDIVSVAKQSNGIEQFLAQKVIGQTKAVKSLKEGYLASCISNAQGPRAIFTFAGPSGVGKTYLAKTFAESLKSFGRTGYGISVFDMSLFSLEDDVLKVFGTGVQYSKPNIGILTNIVRNQPRQVLVFDEIEKASSAVIQSFLPLLDSGFVKDRTTQEVVDFSQCIIIFTTNLGQELLAKNTLDKEISITDVLQTSVNSVNGKGLSPEFVNRLSKGNSVFFSELKVNHLVKLAEMELASHSCSNSSISYKYPPEFPGFMLETMSPDVTVRQLNNSLAKLQSDMLIKSTSLPLDKLTTLDFNIELNPVFRDSYVGSKFLFVDANKTVYEGVKALVPDGEVSICQHPIEVLDSIAQVKPTALLINLSSFNYDCSKLLQFIDDELGGRLPSVSIFTYQFAKKKSDEIRNSEIREHFIVANRKLESSLLNLIKRVNYHVSLESRLDRMIRRREALTYSSNMSVKGRCIKVSFENFKTNQLLFSDDLRDNQLFTPQFPEDRLDDVVGLDRAKAKLKQVVNWLKHPDELNQKGVTVPNGYLLSGAPGTGKTMLARAVANESDLAFFAVSAADLTSTLRGGATEKIKKLFATAYKYAPAIVFIDEIDAIASDRSSAGMTAEENLVVNTLLTELDGFAAHHEPIFVMAATNHVDSLDKAIVRPGRFDEVIHCDLPNREARQIFFEKVSKKHNVTYMENDKNDFINLSIGMSVAQLDLAFREAVYRSVNGVPLTIQSIKQTLIEVSYGKANERVILNEQERRRVAYHEAGHLLINKLLFPNQIIDFATIEPRSQSLGFVSMRALEEFESTSKRTIESRIEVALAGRTAEKLFIGSDDEVSNGAANDIAVATKLAIHAVYEGGLDKSVGLINVHLLPNTAEKIQQDAEMAVRNWLSSAERSVEQRLIKNKNKLEKIAEELYQKESLLSDEIESLWASINVMSNEYIEECITS